jgi:hypothetical protein
VGLRRQVSRARGSTKARGYGAKHKALRRRWALEVREGLVNCARCGDLIYPDDLWDLGHVDGDKSRYAGPEHRACNRATATHKAKRKRRRYVAFVDAGRPWVSQHW